MLEVEDIRLYKLDKIIEATELLKSKSEDERRYGRHLIEHIIFIEPDNQLTSDYIKRFSELLKDKEMEHAVSTVMMLLVNISSLKFIGVGNDALLDIIPHLIKWLENKNEDISENAKKAIVYIVVHNQQILPVVKNALTTIVDMTTDKNIIKNVIDCIESLDRYCPLYR